MKTFLKILLTALAVMALEYLLPGVDVGNNYATAVWVAIVIALLNMFVRPLLIFFTLPATLVTFGLFLFVINALIVLLADYFVDGFTVKNLLWALLFSLLLSFLQSVIQSLFNSEK